VAPPLTSCPGALAIGSAIAHVTAHVAAQVAGKRIGSAVSHAARRIRYSVSDASGRARR
jgi:hypothetical protein